MYFEEQKFSDLELAENKTTRIINAIESGLINLNHSDHKIGFWGLKIDKYPGDKRGKYFITSEQRGEDVYTFAQEIVKKISSREIIIDENIKEIISQ